MMRHIIGFIQSLFCQHEWEYLGETRHFYEGHKIPYEIVDRWRCKKCGIVIMDTH